MSLTAQVHTNIEPELKEAANQVFQKLGISEEDAIKLFYKQVYLQQDLPFSHKIPNQETIDAMKEGETLDDLPSYNSFSEIRKELGI